MALSGAAGRLRDRFDEARHPPAQGRPRTHHRDYYLATDGSVGPEGGRLGAVVETIDGVRVGAWCRRAPVADNNDAELKALHWGLDMLAARSPPRPTVGILLDHDLLGEGIARAVGTPRRPAPEPPIPSSSRHHWGGILARVGQCDAVGIAVAPGDRNPAHALAADGGPKVRGVGDRCVRATAVNHGGRVGRRSSDAT